MIPILMLGATTRHLVADPTTPTFRAAPPWLGLMLIVIGAMFVAAIIAGLIRRPQPEPSPDAAPKAMPESGRAHP